MRYTTRCGRRINKHKHSRKTTRTIRGRKPDPSAAIVSARRWLRLILIMLLAVLPGVAGERFETGQRIMVYDTKAEALISMPLERYVERALAAEMPTSYGLEALKAQAVAARTRAVAGHCARYPEANVCTDSACCQAYLDDAGQRVKWGLSYPLLRAKLERAVVDSAGKIITYDGKPILVLYHAISGGRTEDVELVFSEPLPYLRGVDSPGEEFGSKYKGRVSVTREEFIKTINDALPEAALNVVELESQTEILRRSESGRALDIRVGGVNMDGRRMRGLFGLNSANFTITFTTKDAVFDTIGYGHGVGMSQVGAEAMARGGADYPNILTHYYTGVSIADYP